MEYNYVINIAGKDLRCSFIYEETALCFKNCKLRKTDILGDIYVLPSEWKYWEYIGNKRSFIGEFTLLTSAISDDLLKYNRCIIHAVAFTHNEKAWLIAADPGVGKSTQIKYLQKLYPGEFDIICGDRPVLERMNDGSFFVHPSPWNGKEGWQGAPGAPLEGILFLERGNYTELLTYKKEDAIIPLFQALISNCETEDTIIKLTEFETSLLQSCKLFKYVNGGVPESTKYLYKTLFSRKENHVI